MSANPEAAPSPVRKRGGMDQKIPREAVIPTRAIDKPTSEIPREGKRTAIASPTAPTRQVQARLPIRFPLRSTAVPQITVPTQPNR